MGNTTNVEDVLKQRGAIYGSYSKGVACRANMLRALNDKHRETHEGEPLPADMVVIFSDVLLKLMRMASDPSHEDSYIDLAGYATIIKEAKVDGK